VAFTKVNMGPALWAGIGTAITYVGFYILYSKFGASFYALYGMLAMLTTSIFLAIVILKERFNWSIGVSIGLAGVALGFFLYGQLMNQRAAEALTAPTALAGEPPA
jgi:drug/metabolite transporter (DMT)-like permease